MKQTSANVPIEKSVVLVGAGNAHLVFVKRWGMRPVPGVAVTLVNEASVIPYSAMVPAHLAGEYSWDDITIDLVRLCQSVQVRFVAQRVQAIDPASRQVLFAARPPLTYDALSLGLGSIPACPGHRADDDKTLVLRPLATLIRKLEILEEDLRHSPRPFHFVVVGGGASGCELSLAIHKRLGKYPGFRLTLLHGDARLVPLFPEGTARAFASALQQRRIACQVNARVVGSAEGSLLVNQSDRVAFDAVLWATQAAPPPLVRDSGLAVDAGGFLQVHETLQSITDPAVFGTGDCVNFAAYPNLLKNGVHAVRQGAVLFDNVVAFLKEEPVRPFRPQRYCLCLLNTADGQAILNYGPVTWKSGWARKLKERIDRAWIMKFTQFAPMSATEAGQPDAPQMRCGGCGSKISSDVLSAVLRRLDLPDDPRILMGCRAGEDAAVHRVRPELFSTAPEKLLEVQTVDYFKAFIDDPYLFGRIAALHAVSDLYAMNARPFSALAIATLPYARGPVQEAQLYELLAGAVETFRQAKMVLTGGHTTEGSELALGFAVTGFAEEGKLFQKSKLRPGDVLILTKPIGSGALLAAWMRGECPARWFEPLIASLLQPNVAAAEIFARLGVTACTDVTGFGLAGHLLEMLDGSQVAARLSADMVPLHAGFDDVVRRGIVSTLQPDNAKVRCRITTSDSLKRPPHLAASQLLAQLSRLGLPAWLFDPQTSGGLLAGVPADSVAQALRELHAAGCQEAAAIGDVIPASANEPPMIIL